MRGWRRYRCSRKRSDRACSGKGHGDDGCAVTPLLKTRIRSTCRRREDFTGRGFGIARRREAR